LSAAAARVGLASFILFKCRGLFHFESFGSVTKKDWSLTTATRFPALAIISPKLVAVQEAKVFRGDAAADRLARLSGGAWPKAA